MSRERIDNARIERRGGNPHHAAFFIYHNHGEKFILVAIIAIICRYQRFTLIVLFVYHILIYYFMTHYYLLIVAGPQLDDTTKFYKVGVGCSKQSNRDFLFLTALAVERNYYFKLWTQEVADFFHRVVNSIYHISDNMITTIPNYDYVTARDVVRHFKKMDAISRSEQNLAQRDHFMKSLNLNYRIISNLRKK